MTYQERERHEKRMARGSRERFDRLDEQEEYNSQFYDRQAARDICDLDDNSTFEDRLAAGWHGVKL